MRRHKASFIFMAAAASLVGGLPASALTESLPEISRTTIYGALEGQRLGGSVAGAGDFDGDGLSDLVVGGRGRAYVILGGPTGDLSVTSPERAIEMAFAAPDQDHVFVVAGLEDVNGDGLADVAVGVAQADPMGRKNAGSVFVVFGRHGRDSILLDPVPGSGVVRIDGGGQGARAGTAVASAGDVDGDETPDLILGAPMADDGSGKRRGAAYVLFGRALTEHVDLGRLSSEGYRIDRPNFGRDVGKSVSTAGDMNRDGLDDVVVGAPSSLVTAPPAAYVVFGQATTEPIALGNLSGRGWLIRAGDKENEEGAGEAVAGGHDVNADGVPDIAIGAPNAAGPFHRNGIVFVIFGKSDGATVALDALEGAGYRIFGGDRAQDVGDSVALLPDQDGNGSADVLVGVPLEQRGPYSEADFGAVYHLAGQTTVDDIHLWRLGTAGVRYSGEGYEQAGSSVAATSNFHGDRAVDLVAGAPRWSGEAGEATGRVYVFRPVAPPAHDRPPRVRLISYATRQTAKFGSYCWDGLCGDLIPTFQKVAIAGTGNRAHYRVMFPERPDRFSLHAYRELDESGRPAGAATGIDADLSPVRLYAGAKVSSYEAVFRLPKRPGEVYLVGRGSWEGEDRGDVSWFSHLRLKKQEARTRLDGPPETTLRSDDVRQRGALSSYCWSQSYSNGTGSTLCADFYRLGPRKAQRAQAGARAFIRIHTRHRPDRVRLRFYPQESGGYPSGPDRRVRIRLQPHRREGALRAWDVGFRLPRRRGHLYPLMYATWDQHGTAPYDWHLRLE